MALTLRWLLDQIMRRSRSRQGKWGKVGFALPTLRLLKKQGANLYCWSSGGADYAQKSAAEFSIADIFTAFPATSHD